MKRLQEFLNGQYINMQTSVDWCNKAIGAANVGDKGTLFRYSVAELMQNKSQHLRLPYKQEVEELFAKCSVVPYKSNKAKGIKLSADNGQELIIVNSGKRYLNDDYLSGSGETEYTEEPDIIEFWYGKEGHDSGGTDREANNQYHVRYNIKTKKLKFEDVTMLTHTELQAIFVKY